MNGSDTHEGFIIRVTKSDGTPFSTNGKKANWSEVMSEAEARLLGNQMHELWLAPVTVVMYEVSGGEEI